MSRRRFLDRLATLGLGLGAAAALGTSADAAPIFDEGISIGSNDPMINDIIDYGRRPGTEGGKPHELMRLAQSRRRSLLTYERIYARADQQYPRAYRRGGYPRFYPRVYRRFLS